MFMTTIAHSVGLIKSIQALVLLCLLVIVQAPAQTERRDDLTTLIKQHASWNPGEFILDKLRINRIVMIADAEHGVGLYHKVIINSLDLWLAAWENSRQGSPPSDLPARLFLVLEMNSLDVLSLEEYFITGDLMKMVTPEKLAGNFTTADLEFYNDLRNLKHRVDQFNKNHGAIKTINFDVVGPEKVINYDVWTEKRRDQFFAYERDEYSSSKIIALLDSVSDAKALTYYGGAHIARQKEPKLGENEGWGYYMAHYLSDHFPSSGGLYTCQQIPVPRFTWNDEAVRKVARTFAIDHSFLRGVAISPGSYFWPSDGVIYHFLIPHESARISTIRSENLADVVLAKMRSFTDTTKPWQKRNLGLCFDYLSKLALTEVRSSDVANRNAIDSTIRAWDAWQQSTTLDVVKDLSSMGYFTQILDQMSRSDGGKFAQYEGWIAQLTGFRVWLPPNASKQERLDALSHWITKYHKPILIDNLIRLLWIGSRDEIERARVILKKETGENFDTAKQWTRWWESKSAD
jgi:hypothetical protein